MYEQQRKEMADACKREGIKDKAILDAIMKVHRHLFVPKGMGDSAYGNYPLPIGAGQTISQPYTVAFMLQALELKKGHKVLEVGTGSGWNAALIAEMVKPGKVYTTEIVPELAVFARKNLKKYSNAEVVAVDGSAGYKKEAPYDRIVVTAACPRIPMPLIKQLADEGVLVAPVGEEYGQQMMQLKKKGDKILERNLGSFVFVPLIGKYGFKR
jgi:protein-L-isoaspartate(D-aspartate) O-methyltransferase